MNGNNPYMLKECEILMLLNPNSLVIIKKY